MSQGDPMSNAGGTALVVPLGLSFFTLRSLGFVIDVYRGTAAPCSDWCRFAAFLSFFPSFVAGPITRGAPFFPQLQRGLGMSWGSLVEGASIFLQGLAKKMLIADRLATIVNPVFANPELYSPWGTAAGVLAYALQIYCDFSGYSDMALGAARVIGIDVPKNFDMPYLATNIAEFWHRWHITLSTWLRDYLFLPTAYAGSRWVEELGLSRRRGELVNHATASIITMLLAGLWHGSGWGFLIWGGAHGVALATHRVWQGGGPRRRRMPAWPGRLLTFVFVCLAWIPFRAATVNDAAAICASLLGRGSQQTYVWFPEWLPICAAAVALGHMLTLWLTTSKPEPESTGSSARRRVLSILGLTPVARPLAGVYLVPTRVTVVGTYVIVILCLSIVLFSPPKVGPFVYGAF
jgi:alginate O-acetyltransferase complex protein AlgI